MRPSHFFPLALLSLATSSFTPLPPTCSSYPSYNATTLSAGPFTLAAESPLSPINNASASFVTFTNNGTDRYGLLTIPLTNPNFAVPAPRLSARCVAPGLLQAEVSAGEWVGVSVAGAENWQGTLAFGLEEEGVQVRPFARNGTGGRGGDVYIGAGSSARWGFKHNWGGNAGEYFLVRWVAGEEGEVRKRQDGPIVDDRDWVGWVRVEA